MRRKEPDSKVKYLWRYMDIPRFIDLVMKKRLYFTSLDKFNDIFEGISERQYAWIDTCKDLTQLKTINGLDHQMQWSDYGKEILRTNHELKNIQKNYYACSFYVSDIESVAMWNLYTKMEGVAIRFNATELYQYIKSYYKKELQSNYRFFFGPLNYKDFRKFSLFDENGKVTSKMFDNSPFIKNEIYKHENEYRFIFEKQLGNEYEPHVSLEEFSDDYYSVIACPDMEEWKINILEEMVKNLTGKKSFFIDRSEFITQNYINKFKEVIVSENFK